MGADGSRGPRPFKQRRASTLFVRVPSSEWPEVKRGLKREFRALSGHVSALWNVEPPTPIVAYRINGHGEYDARLMVLEDLWREPLGAISPESLAAEGCESLHEFKRAWLVRRKRYFNVLAQTTVYRLRPWGPKDEREMADRILQGLYGEFVPASNGPREPSTAGP
jgi:hypothetical protein